MNGQRSQDSDRTLFTPSHPNRPGQFLEEHSGGNHGLQINNLSGNSFFFNNPGEYSICWGNDVSSGRPQAQLGQLSRNLPAASWTSMGADAPSAQRFGWPGAGSATTSADNQPDPIPATANGNGNQGNEPSSVQSVAAQAQQQRRIVRCPELLKMPPK